MEAPSQDRAASHSPGSPACVGEMAQADASVHDWLEGRGPRMALVGMIDDATGRIFVRFYKSETTEAYMDLLMRYIKEFGRPLIWHSDRAGIFRAEETVAGYDSPREHQDDGAGSTKAIRINCCRRSFPDNTAARPSSKSDLMARRTSSSKIYIRSHYTPVNFRS